MIEHNAFPDISTFVMVETDEQLKVCCESAMQKPCVMLDTEFVRTRTFYAKLGLIQLFDGCQISLIDPLSIQDFSPFIALLADHHVRKVLHASGEDLEIFKHRFQQLPTPMVDTQVVAQFLGFGASAGLASLLKHYFHFEMDKGESRTNWLARPLSPAQLNYATGDVGYLLPLYKKMMQDLASTPWESALHSECEYLLEKAKKTPSPQTMYLKIPCVQKLQGKALLRLQMLSAWRYEEAKKRDLALNFVIKGEHLWQIAKYGANSRFDLSALGLFPCEIRHYGKKVLQILSHCELQPETDYPILKPNAKQIENYKVLNKKAREILVKILPDTLPQELVANKKRLDNFLLWYGLGKNPETLPDLLQNWRKPFGEGLLKGLDT